MVWFIFSLSCIGLAYYAERASSSINKKSMLYILAFVISIMTGLSGKVATDHEHYIDIFENIDSLSYFQGYSIISIILSGGAIEPGFALICLFCHSLGIGKVGFFVTVAFITNLLMLKIFSRFPRLWLVVLLLLVSTHFYYQTNLVRQMLVVSGFVYSVQFLQEKKIKKYLVSISILSLFHLSAIPLSIFSAFCYVNDENKERKISLLTFVIWIISFIVAFIGVSLGPADTLLNMVMGGTIYGRYTTGDGGLSTGYGLAYIYNVFVVLSFYLFTLNNKWNRQYFIYVVLFQIGGIIINMASAAEALVRVSLYFTIFQFVILPYMTTLRKSNNKTLVISKFILFFLVMYYGVYILGYTYIIQEESLLGKEMYSITDFFK